MYARARRRRLNLRRLAQGLVVLTCVVSVAWLSRRHELSVAEAGQHLRVRQAAHAAPNPPALSAALQDQARDAGTDEALPALPVLPVLPARVEPAVRSLGRAGPRAPARAARAVVAASSSDAGGAEATAETAGPGAAAGTPADADADANAPSPVNEDVEDVLREFYLQQAHAQQA